MGDSQRRHSLGEGVNRVPVDRGGNLFFNCPFCDGRAITIEETTTASVAVLCICCGACTPVYKTASGAIKKWSDWQKRWNALAKEEAT